ncbi:MAG: phosphate ABC transporter substrate-binding protein [Desulfovibrionaceae bacterium]|nr:phosphate ABC transporter substrate-binding protein [Desulfovibrionaceae bacterium]
MRQRIFCSLVLCVACALFPLSTRSSAMEKGGGAPKDNPALQSTLSYEGASSIAYSLMPELAKTFLTKNGVAFGNIGEAGAGAGFKAVTEGKVSLGGLARSLSDSEKAAVAGWQIFGFDALGLHVHPSNPISSLTRAQLKAVFSGRITNWKDVGGADQEIVVFTEHLKSGRATLAVIKDIVLEGGAYGPVKEREDPMDCIWAVEEEPRGITFSTISIASPRTKTVAVDGMLPERAHVASAKYLLSRPLVLVTMMPSGNVQKFFEFVLTPEGQAIVGKFFVPIR